MLWGINGYSVGRPHNLGLKIKCFCLARKVQIVF